MATILIGVLVLTTVIALRSWQLAHRRAAVLWKELAGAREDNRRYTAEVKAKEEELQALKAKIVLAARRAPKPAGDTIRAKNWRQVLTINEHERANKEHEEEMKHANTERR